MTYDKDMSKFVPVRSICGECARATALEGRLGCDWIRELKPVYGMRYRKRIAYSGNTKSKTICLRVVVDCPDFIAEGSNASLEQAQKRARIGQTANEKNYLRLAVAIAKSVVCEYRSALESGNESRISYLERELRSDHFHMISGLDGDAVIEQVRKEFEEGDQ